MAQKNVLCVCMCVHAYMHAQKNINFTVYKSLLNLLFSFSKQQLCLTKTFLLKLKILKLKIEELSFFKKDVFLIIVLKYTQCYCLYQDVDCYLCTHTQKNVILVPKNYSI